MRFRPNYTVVYTWHQPPLPHSSVFKALAQASKPPGFDDILAPVRVGCNLNGIRVLRGLKKAAALHLSITGYYKHFSMSKLIGEITGNCRTEKVHVQKHVISHLILSLYRSISIIDGLTPLTPNAPEQIQINAPPPADRSGERPLKCTSLDSALNRTPLSGQCDYKLNWIQILLVSAPDVEFMTPYGFS